MGGEWVWWSLPETQETCSYFRKQHPALPQKVGIQAVLKAWPGGEAEKYKDGSPHP